MGHHIAKLVHSGLAACRGRQVHLRTHRRQSRFKHHDDLAGWTDPALVRAG
jgi:hypothetical protein